MHHNSMFNVGFNRAAMVRRSPRLAEPKHREALSKSIKKKKPVSPPKQKRVVPEHKQRSAKKEATQPQETHTSRLVLQAKALKRLPSRDLEVELWKMGFHRVIGVDEAGRGPLAGPVVAAACVIPQDLLIEGIDDSKKLTAEKREGIYAQLVSSPGVLFSVCVVDAARIDEINILQATMQAMTDCVEKLTIDGLQQYILVDGNRIPDGLAAGSARCVIKGDSECHIIAAASILAKVTRDRLMDDYDKKWPQYGFKSHKGYGTASHTAALLKYGPCEIHRRSFAPLKNQLVKENSR